MDVLAGKKTVLAGIVMIVYAIAALALGQVEAAHAIELIIAGITVICMRLGIKKAEE